MGQLTRSLTPLTGFVKWSVIPLCLLLEKVGKTEKPASEYYCDTAVRPAGPKFHQQHKVTVKRTIKFGHDDEFGTSPGGALPATDRSVPTSAQVLFLS